MSRELFMQQNLKEGELYAGIVLGQNGEGDYHLILLPDETKKLNWNDAMAWAVSVGGSLPNCEEQAILCSFLRDSFLIL